MTETTVTGDKRSVLRSPRRLLLAALGVLCVGLAVAGAILPGLPTTIFLIAATYLFARSCPWLEDRLVRNRLFRPYLRYIDGEEAMPLRARLTAMAMMWTAVATSLAMLAWADRLEPWFAALLVGLALVGTVAIARFRANVPERAPATNRSPNRRP